MKLEPETSSIMLLTDVCTVPPVAAATRCKSSSVTRPAQNISRSAKYWSQTNPSTILSVKSALSGVKLSKLFYNTAMNFSFDDVK